MATNLTALQAAIKVVADVVSDSVAAASATSSAAKLADFENLLPDVMALIPQIGDVPSEASALAPADYATLVESLASDLSLPNGKVESIITAAVKLISDIATVIVPDVEAVLAAAKA